MRTNLELARWVNLLGQAFVKSDPREVMLPEDAPPESMAALVAEIRRSREDPVAAEVEYRRLFASALDTSGPLWQPALLAGEAREEDAAREWFRRYGFEPAAGTGHAAHLGQLLLFYARLLASGEESETLASFRADHLLWAPPTLTQIAAEARHPLYRVLAETAIAVLA